MKHTFSCVNGTVFNQMSFTCTRYEDSIPCESSPNYFYLNKRNGDPKAYFLTDEDIVKTSSSAPKNSFLLNNLIEHRPVFTAKESYEPKLSSSSNKDVRLGVASSHKPTTPTNYVQHTPVHFEKDDYTSLNSLVGSFHHQKNSASAPYEKYFSNNNNKQPGVRYTSQPQRISAFEMPPPSFESKADFGGFSGGDGVSRSASAIPQKYQSMMRAHEPINSKIDQMFINNDHALDEPKSVYSFTEQPIRHTPKPPLKKSTFTPAAFSKMYIENQKAKYHSNPLAAYRQSGILPKNNSYESMIKPDKSHHSVRSNGATATASAIENKVPLYSEVSNSMFRLPPSKYDDSNYDEIKSSKYVVPSSIRIIEPNENLPSGTEATEAPLTNSVTASLLPRMAGPPPTEEIESSHGQPNEPVRMYFNTKPNGRSSVRTGPQQPPQTENLVGNYQNFKVVKQVKGKNLLIDPSLENDPARDNIIAQVLEMLSKYN